MDTLRINLEQTNPLRFADPDYPEDLFDAVKRLSHWEAETLKWTDSILLQWISDAFGTPDNREGWAFLHSLIQRIQVIQSIDGQPEIIKKTVAAYYFKWDGIAELLEARAHRDDNHSPEEIECRTNMKELRGILSKYDAGLSRSALEKQIDLSPVRLSQLLDVAEAASLISRRTKNGIRLISVNGIWSNVKSG